MQVLRHLSAADERDATSSELFVVVERSTFDDAAFWRKVDPLLDRVTFHVATVSRTGEFELVLASRAGRRRIAAATLDLSSLLDGSGPARKIQTLLTRDPSLPMILRLAQFPLRLPTRVNAKFAMETPRAGLIGMSFGRPADAVDGNASRWETVE